ncbi:MAG: hypothetical protein ABJN34_03310 [Litoreibacter sp.]|uniref:hypothetical protein n=1 Tax=Litoreibacter sp. TaxID=1969459 RepID=UPI00329791A0
MPCRAVDGDDREWWGPITQLIVHGLVQVELSWLQILRVGIQRRRDSPYGQGASGQERPGVDGCRESEISL